jgi:hypothetical protein
MPSLDKELLAAALSGLETQRDRLTEQIAEVRRILGTRKSTPTKTFGAPRKKRTLSAEARKSIAAAQKKRWANFRRSQQ